MHRSKKAVVATATIAAQNFCNCPSVGALCGYLPDSVAHDRGVPHVDSASEYEDIHTCLRVRGAHEQLNRMAGVSPSTKTFTPEQGQYLAYIHHYTRLHRRSPAETDMQEYFRVSPPSVHQMVLTLERAGLIRRQPRTPRSIEILVDPKLLPELT